MPIVIFVVTANNVNPFFCLRDVCVKGTRNQSGWNHMVGDLRAFDKVDEIGSVF